MSDLQELIDDACQELQDWMNDNQGDSPDDQIPEIADSSVPVYYGDLLDLAQSDISLATTEPELGAAFDGSNTACNIIASCVYERLTAELWDYYKEHEDDYLNDELEEEESEEV